MPHLSVFCNSLAGYLKSVLLASNDDFSAVLVGNYQFPALRATKITHTGGW